MLQRFASAALVAVVAVAVAVLVLLLIPGLTLRQASPILALWSLAPCAWGLWAMLAPKRWVPDRLPIWGSILGVIAASLAMLVLNLPKLAFGQEFGLGLRSVAVVVLGCFYYVLWTIVAAVYRKLAPSPVSVPTGRTAKAA
jgi:hypothetical protein